MRHFADAPIAVWQVENEPYLSFGGPPLGEHPLRREIELVRALDGRPIMLTDSADKGDWSRSSRWCDNPRRKPVHESLGQTPLRRHRPIRVALQGQDPRGIVLGQRRDGRRLQAEPWGPRPVTELTRSEEAITMSPELLRRNVRIASGAGFRTALFWGVEWYWLRTRGDPSMWEAARALVEEHR